VYLLNFRATPFNMEGSGQRHMVMTRKSNAGLGEGAGRDCIGGWRHGHLIGGWVLLRGVGCDGQ
jgi:hypothetical protein